MCLQRITSQLLITLPLISTLAFAQDQTSPSLSLNASNTKLVTLADEETHTKPDPERESDQTITGKWFGLLGISAAILPGTRYETQRSGAEPATPTSDQGSDQSQVVDCVDISGRWHGTESGTVTCELLGESDTESFRGSNTINVTQSECGFRYVIRAPAGVEAPDLVRTGTIAGSRISLTGDLVIVPPPGFTVVRERFEATGTASGSSVNLDSSSSATFRSNEGLTITCSVMSTVGMTRSGTDVVAANLSFPHFVNGEVDGHRNRVRIVLQNSSDFIDTGTVQFTDRIGQPIPMSKDNLLADTVDYRVGPRGTLELETDGTDELRTGSIEVRSTRGARSAIEGTLIFEVLGHSVSVSSSLQGDSHQVYVSRTEEENTALAAYNPHPTLNAFLEVLLLDQTGDQKALVYLRLRPREQLARFVDEEELFESFFNQHPEDFKGSLRITLGGKDRAATVALIQRRSNGALIAVSTAVGSTGSPPIFPQYVNGQLGTSRNRTRVILRNPVDRRDTGSVQFLDARGNPASITVNGSLTDRVNYAGSPWGTAEFETDGTGPLLNGSIEISSDRDEDSGLKGTVIFEVLGNAVSVDNAPARSSHRVYVSRNTMENTGFAAYNPHDSLTASLDIALLDGEGVQKAARAMQLLPGQQIASFVDEEQLFQDFFNETEGDFEGSLNISVANGGTVSTIGLLQRLGSGALIAVSTSSNAVQP